MLWRVGVRGRERDWITECWSCSWPCSSFWRHLAPFYRRGNGGHPADGGGNLGLLGSRPLPSMFSQDALPGRTDPGATLSCLCEKAASSHFSWKKPCLCSLLMWANSPVLIWKSDRGSYLMVLSGKVLRTALPMRVSDPHFPGGRWSGWITPALACPRKQG